MNIKKELIKTLKNLMGVYFGKVWTPNELNISDKEVGGKVEQIGADGTLTPVEDGEYTMEDGFTFTVKDGQIETIQDQTPEDETYDETLSKCSTGKTSNDVEDNQEVPPAFAEETPAEDATETPKDETTETPAEQADEQADMDRDARITALEEKVEVLTKMLSTASDANMASAKEIEKFSSIVSELNNNIVTLSKVPVEFSKTNKSVAVVKDKEDKILSMAKILGQAMKK